MDGVAQATGLSRRGRGLVVGAGVRERLLEPDGDAEGDPLGVGEVGVGLQQLDQFPHDALAGVAGFVTVCRAISAVAWALRYVSVAVCQSV